MMRCLATCWLLCALALTRQPAWLPSRLLSSEQLLRLLHIFTHNALSCLLFIAGGAHSHGSCIKPSLCMGVSMYPVLIQLSCCCSTLSAVLKAKDGSPCM